MIINYSLSFQLLDSYVSAFNEDQPVIGTKVRQSMVATMKEIIRIYGAFLQKADKVSAIDREQLPSLRTNNVQLSKLTHASARTVQRHINRLLSSGILTNKIWHGTNASYELFITPKILWINGLEDVEKPKTIAVSEQKSVTDNQLITKNKRTKCPHTETYKKTYKRNNIVIDVDFVTTSDCLNPIEDLSISVKPKKRTKKTRRKDTWREALKNNGAIVAKRQTGAQNFQRKPRGKKAGDTVFEDSRHAFLSTHYASALWELAKKELYSDVWLNKRQQNIGLTLGYKWYEAVKPHVLEKAHQQYTNRIYMVAKYVRKDPDHRFVQLPYQFFDINNENGFKRTKLWYCQQQNNQHFLYLQRIAVKEIRKFKRNEQKDTAAGIPRLELYRQCEQRISKLGIPKLLDRFYASCSPLLQNEC